MSPAGGLIDANEFEEYIFTFLHVVKSLNIVRSLVSKNVESYLEQPSTFSQCCLEILNHVQEINAKAIYNSYLRECLIDLKSGISRLNYWSSGCDVDKYTLKQVMMICQNAVENALSAFLDVSNTVNGRIFATILRIVTEILRNLTTPDTAVIRCLQFLQELHDLPVIQVKFSSLIKGDSEIISYESSSVHKINKILFKFVRMFFKPSPTVEEWPATIRLDKQVYNPLIEERFLEERLKIATRPVSSHIDNVIKTDENVESSNTYGVEYNGPVIESSLETSNNRYTTSATNVKSYDYI